MKTSRAIQLLKELLLAEMQRMAFDANMHDVYGATYSQAIRASARRRNLMDGMSYLECLETDAAAQQACPIKQKEI